MAHSAEETDGDTAIRFHNYPQGRQSVRTATLKPNAPLGSIKGEVTIHTNNPDQPEIRVPVYAYVEE